MLLSADLFEEGGEGALAAQGLGQEVEGGLRAALVEVAPGLAAAALGGGWCLAGNTGGRKAARAAGICGAAARDIVERRTAS